MENWIVKIDTEGKEEIMKCNLEYTVFLPLYLPCVVCSL